MAPIGMIRVSTSDNTSPMNGVTVKLYEGKTLLATQTTDINGETTFSDLNDDNITYTVIPDERGVTFSPASQDLTLTPSHGDQEATFTGTR